MLSVFDKGCIDEGNLYQLIIEVSGYLLLKASFCPQ